MKKHENGIAIFAPCKYRQRSRIETDDREKKSLQQIRGVRVVYVFDISHTEGDPWPNLDAVHPKLLDGDAPDGIWDALVEAAGFEVVRDQRRAENGYCDSRTGSLLDEARTLNELARVERLDGNVDLATQLLRQSIRMLGDHSDIAELGLAFRELALCETSTDPNAAEKDLRRAIELLERAEERSELATTYRTLGDLLEERGKTTEALTTFRSGIVALESISST